MIWDFFWLFASARWVVRVAGWTCVCVQFPAFAVFLLNLFHINYCLHVNNLYRLGKFPFSSPSASRQSNYLFSYSERDFSSFLTLCREIRWLRGNFCLFFLHFHLVSLVGLLFFVAGRMRIDINLILSCNFYFWAMYGGGRFRICSL